MGDYCLLGCAGSRGGQEPQPDGFLLQSSHLGLPRVPLPGAELGLQGDSRVVSAPTVLLVSSIGLKQELQQQPFQSVTNV